MPKRRLFDILAVVMALAATFAPCAVSAGPVPRDIEIEVLGDRSGELRQIPVRLNRRPNTTHAYLEAHRGEGYAIRVRNRSGERVGLVIAVDGRNIVTGERSELAGDERKYVLGPYASATYEGWRTSRNRVNRFYFTDAGGSYADAFGDHSAMGVIAVAVFREKASPPQWVDEPRLAPQAQAQARRPGAQPGTGFGESEWSPSRTVRFEPEERASRRHFLKYEWRETLCRRGVIECRGPRNRFWDEDRADSDDGYAPHPPGWPERDWRRD